MSRKTLLTIFAVLGAFATYIDQNLTVTTSEAVSALGVVLLYVFFEFKKDLERTKAQKKKWLDPKFWLGAIPIVLSAIKETAGLAIPVDVINVVLGGLMTLLFKVK